jgi:peptide deformylase
MSIDFGQVNCYTDTWRALEFYTESTYTKLSLREEIMAVKSVLLIGNETLRKKSEEVDFDTDNVTGIISDLKNTLHHLQKVKNIGRALAGIQIGYMKRIVYLNLHDRSFVMINPKITKKSEEKFEVWDSCFSADVAFFSKTSRFKRISVEYYDEKKNAVNEEFENDMSELLQHEIDHLDGVLFVDHIIDNEIIMRSEWEKLYQEKEHN